MSSIPSQEQKESKMSKAMQDREAAAVEPVNKNETATSAAAATTSSSTSSSSTTTSGEEKKKPSLYEATFIPREGFDLATDAKHSHLHSTLLSPDYKLDSYPMDRIKLDFINKELFGNRAIVLHNLASPEECDDIIALTKELDMHDANRDHRYRNNMRTEIQCPRLAEILFHRVKNFVEQQKVVTKENCGDYPQLDLFTGIWDLHGMNTHFRLCTYSKGGHFSTHYDGEYNPQVNLCSIKTFMIYLNDEYEDGETNFCKDHLVHFDEKANKFCSPKEAVIASLKAKKGDCLIFDHKILHEGMTVNGVDGCKKHILRSELMYEREDNLSALEKEARSYLAQAKYYEDEKDGENAIRCYKKAFKLMPELERLC